jgi:hypothetical protein
MSEKQPQPPRLTEPAKSEAARRQERLAAALRDNLKKRKQQARQRADEATPRDKG